MESGPVWSSVVHEFSGLSSNCWSDWGRSFEFHTQEVVFFQTHLLVFCLQLSILQRKQIQYNRDTFSFESASDYPPRSPWILWISSHLRGLPGPAVQPSKHSVWLDGPTPQYWTHWTKASSGDCWRTRAPVVWQFSSNKAAKAHPSITVVVGVLVASLSQRLLSHSLILWVINSLSRFQTSKTFSTSSPINNFTVLCPKLEYIGIFVAFLIDPIPKHLNCFHLVLNSNLD